MTPDDIAYGETVEITVDGAPLRAYTGQTIAAALLASGTRVLRRTRTHGKPRGVYCGMGICYDCVVRVNGTTERACTKLVENGMQISLATRFEPRVPNP